jgi:hypothetical protein
MSLLLTNPRAARVLEAEFQSCFLMGLGFGMIAETSNGIDVCVGALFCAASLCLMLSARSLRETMADIA